MEVFFALLSCLLMVCSASTLPATGSPVRTERDLRRDLFRDYDQLSRPVKDPRTKVELSMNVAPLMIREVNEKEQTIVLDSWIHMSWKDEYLTWDVNSYNNITALRVPSSEIWKPDLAMYTAVNQDSMFATAPTNAIIYPSGVVLWVPMFTITSRCPMFNRNPKSNLECNIQFGSWTFDANLLDPSLSGTEADMANFKDINPDWKLSGVKSNKEDKFYPCCSEAYPVLHFNVTIKRRPSIINKSNEHYSLSY